MAAIGRQLKQSVKVFQSLMLNLRLPTRTVHDVRKRQLFSEANLEYVSQPDQGHYQNIFTEIYSSVFRFPSPAIVFQGQQKRKYLSLTLFW